MSFQSVGTDSRYKLVVLSSENLVSVAKRSPSFGESVGNLVQRIASELNYIDTEVCLSQRIV